jgi:hypothetical protein
MRRHSVLHLEAHHFGKPPPKHLLLDHRQQVIRLLQ